MFTGIIETVQPVLSLSPAAAGARLCLPLGPLAVETRYGQSIAINGVCLTVNELSGGKACFDIMAETLQVTTLGQLQPGRRVNMERALAANGRFDGHFVQGHIDGLGTIAQIDNNKGPWTITIAAEADIMKYMIRKGSVAIDGVSLTIVDCKPNCFSVSLIPTTLKETNLQDRRKGDPVNLEADIVSKWINRRLDNLFSPPNKRPDLTLEQLYEQGFA